MQVLPNPKGVHKIGSANLVNVSRLPCERGVPVRRAGPGGVVVSLNSLVYTDGLAPVSPVRLPTPWTSGLGRQKRTRVLMSKGWSRSLCTTSAETSLLMSMIT